MFLFFIVLIFCVLCSYIIVGAFMCVALNKDLDEIVLRIIKSWGFKCD